MIEKKAKKDEPVAPAAPVTFAAPEVEERKKPHRRYSSW